MKKVGLWNLQNNVASNKLKCALPEKCVISERSHFFKQIMCYGGISQTHLYVVPPGVSVTAIYYQGIMLTRNFQIVAIYLLIARILRWLKISSVNIPSF